MPDEVPGVVVGGFDSDFEQLATIARHTSAGMTNFRPTPISIPNPSTNINPVNAALITLSSNGTSVVYSSGPPLFFGVIKPEA